MIKKKKIVDKSYNSTNKPEFFSRERFLRCAWFSKTINFLNGKRVFKRKFFTQFKFEF